jgi:hypothetical protein
MLIFLSGGPPQHETFDPKPDAPREIRGDFKSIPTAVPGVHLSETLPRLAKMMDRFSIVRSMTTEIQSHATSGAYMLTGYMPTTKAESVPASNRDWPSLAAAVGALKPGQRSPLASVVLPEPLVNNPNIPWPGQDGGFMGSAWHPHLLRCDPNQERLNISDLSRPQGITELRLSERRGLLEQLNGQFYQSLVSPGMEQMDRMQARAFDLIHSHETRKAFEIERESSALRDAYGRHKFGQSLLLGRRLVEAGVRLVQVNWPREPGDTMAGSPLWDTHQNNGKRVREVLCPQLDSGLAALLGDMEDRGVLKETLIVVMGEFGRSPKINGNGGRDHWGNVFSVALAGAGLPAGQIIGASDKIGGFPDQRPIRPPDLAATIFHLLGIAPNQEFIDPIGRPRTVTDGGVPIWELIGSA